MMLSLSPFVCSSVRLSPFFSFKVLGVVSSPKEFQWCVKKVSRVFQGGYMDVSGSFREVYRKFKGL